MTGIRYNFSPVISNNTKVLALEATLQQGLIDFKELLVEFENLQTETDNLKLQLTEQKAQCESKTCCGAIDLKSEFETKQSGFQETIQAVASSITRLNETKNFSIIEDIFKILFNENNAIHSPEKQVPDFNIDIKKEDPSNEDVSFKEESITEIEGTPTGRRSPIIQPKKSKNITSDLRDKKKCPNNWPTPEKKAIKLSFTTPTRSKTGGRLRQARFSVITVKESNFIDITSSPEYSGGCRSQNDMQQLPIKKECFETDDTILPSPTSGPTNFTLFKSKESPMKFKKPLSLKSKTENSKSKKKVDNIAKLKLEPTIEQLVKIKTEKQSQNIENNIDIKMNDSVTYTQENSINILNPLRLANNIKTSPIKERHNETTFCETEASVSLLQHVDNIVNNNKGDKTNSPTKRPLSENINFSNVPEEDDLQSSISLLQRESKALKLSHENGKRKMPDLIEVAYNEPARTKVEKRLQPGWSCEKCVNFYGELYKHDPELMAQKINACSHHRGAQNPERLKTPTNYWNPRWQVPEDTEEFNRKNNA